MDTFNPQQQLPAATPQEIDRLLELNLEVVHAGKALRAATADLAAARQRWDSAIAAVRAARTRSAA